MDTRRYAQGKRGEAAEATRQRIVEATFALHVEQGIAATSMKQIAARAGVSVGAVYHHFPTYDDAIGACGQHVLDTAPPPDAAIFDGAEAAPERVGRLISAMFRHYERMPALELARADRHVSPVLDAFLAEEARHRRTLAEEALRQAGAGERDAALLAALVDIGVWRALVSAGFDTDAAAALIIEMAGARLGR